MLRQVEVVEELIKEFHWEDKKIIHVFNKMDAAPIERQFQVREFPRVFVSALTGQGLEQLKRMMVESINELSTDVQLYFTHAEEYKIYDLSRETKVLKREPGSEGTVLYAQMTPNLIAKWRTYLVK